MPGYGPTVTIAHPPDGVYTTANPLNFTAGQTPADGTMDSDTRMMAYQIDSNPPVALQFTTSSGGTSNWSLPNLTNADCPNTNTTYTLTVYAWNANGSGTAHSTFYRGT
jgi:hypothetical protein